MVWVFVLYSVSFKTVAMESVSDEKMFEMSVDINSTVETKFWSVNFSVLLLFILKKSQDCVEATIAI